MPATQILAVRGVTVPTPMGWSVPDSAERVAALARQYGWTVVDQVWKRYPSNNLMTFFLGVERLLKPGEHKNARGVGWRYHLVWEEVTVTNEENNSNNRPRMAIRVSRAYTPATGEWGNGPSVKTITDTIVRNPLRPSVPNQTHR